MLDIFDISPIDERELKEINKGSISELLRHMWELRKLRHDTRKLLRETEDMLDDDRAALHEIVRENGKMFGD